MNKTQHTKIKLAKNMVHHSWMGICGDECYKCHKTINTPAGNPGWFCPSCGDFIIQSWSHHRFAHNKPDHGPGRTTISQAHKIAKKMSLRLRKFQIGQMVASKESSYQPTIIGQVIEHRTDFPSHLGYVIKPAPGQKQTGTLLGVQHRMWELPAMTPTVQERQIAQGKNSGERS